MSDTPNSTTIDPIAATERVVRLFAREAQPSPPVATALALMEQVSISF